MQTLVTRHAGHPDNEVVRSIGGRDPGRAPSGLTYCPRAHDCGWTRSGNSPGSNRARVVVKAKVRPLTGVIRDSGCPSVNSSHVRLGHS